MKVLNFCQLVVIACLGAIQQASACESVNVRGNWDMVANGFVFVMDLIPIDPNEFGGILNSTSEPSTQIHEGTCTAGSRKIRFVRSWPTGGNVPQTYEGYFWQRDGATSIAGHFWIGEVTASKYGFHMTQHVDLPIVHPACINRQPTLYYDDDFSGDYRVYGRGTSIRDLTGDGDDFSSVCVPDGYRLEAFEDDDFEEPRLTIIGPLEVNDLDNFEINGVQLQNWGDRIDSLKIR